MPSMTKTQKPYVRPQQMTKTELREMLAKAVQNTQPESKPPPKAGKDSKDA